MTVDQSYKYCEGVARSQAKNFYVTFLLLSREQRRAMCAIYAFMRYCDDLSDDAGVADRAAAIAAWSKDLEAALAGAPPANPLWPAFADAVQRYKIPHQYFRDMIAGVSSDLEPRTIETFDELYRYCYQVASVVGLTIIHVFGFDSPEALQLAEKCGVAFQLTNILRDVREDAENGRVYWPTEDLAQFGVAPAHLKGPLTPALKNMLAFEAQRARSYYDESAPLIGMVHTGSRASLRALIGIYSRLLDKIVESDYDVLSQRVRVPTPEKLWILLRSSWAKAQQ
jgi:15-cis-phytoene synthase